MFEASLVEFFNIGIVGVVLSFGIQYVQNRYGAEGAQTRAMAIAFSVVLGGFLWFFQGTALLASITGVLMAASTVYAMVFSGARK